MTSPAVTHVQQQAESVHEYSYHGCIGSITYIVYNYVQETSKGS